MRPGLSRHPLRPGYALPGRTCDAAQDDCTCHLANTGSVTSAAPGFGTDGKAEDSTCSPCAFINEGTVEVDAKAVFSSEGTFVLEPGVGLGWPAHRVRLLYEHGHVGGHGRQHEADGVRLRERPQCTPGGHRPNYLIFVTRELSNYGSLQLGPTSCALVTGDFAQNASGSLDISIAGPSKFGSVEVSGQANLAGGLDIDKLPSYAAHVGDTQQIVTAKAVAGNFRNVSGTSDGPHLGSAVRYSARSVTLKVQKTA